MNNRHKIHLFNRIGFGLNIKSYSALLESSKPEIIDSIFKASKTVKPLEIDLSAYDNLYAMAMNGKLKKGAQLRKKLQKSRQEIKTLNYAWIDRLRDTDQLLREKMTLFWANVFVCKDNSIWHIQEYNNILRTHALGDFGDFVKAIAKSASMSKYLNNRQNTKESPNENFARELMELFTLGIGNYTENDIKEAARAFTGWAFKRDGSFLLRIRKHDYGTKTFMGETGEFDGDDMIDIILKQKECAQFICTKIYTYFVNPKIDEVRLQELTSVFYKDYNIENVMRNIFTSDWFYDEKNIGVKIKSPIELLVGIQNVVPVTFQKKKQLLYIQKVMGQILLDPPNVAGWKQNRSWIDGNTLMVRMKLASLLLNDAIINIDVKGEFEDSFEDYYSKEKQKNRFIKVNADWETFHKNYKNTSFQTLKTVLIASKIDKDTENYLETLSATDKKEFLIQLMSLPEYQLC